MQRMSHRWKYLLCFLITLGLSFFIFSLIIPKANARLVASSTNVDKNQKMAIHFVAIGDSLTQGVGDTTNSGGFVPIISKSLTDNFHLNAVQTDNYGISGERSDQILARIKKDEKLQESVKSADVITLTVGGNDLMKIIQNNILNDITENTFKKPTNEYQEQLKEIYNELRKLNKTAPIYQFGIYNPFYVYFADTPELQSEMQSIVENWNTASEEVVADETDAYFIPINDLLYNGLEGQVGVTVDSEETTDSSARVTPKNNLIFEEDHFHPNNLGYQLMANALRDEMVKTKEKWLDKN